MLALKLIGIEHAQDHEALEEAQAEIRKLSNYKVACDNLRRVDRKQVEDIAKRTAERDEAQAENGRLKREWGFLGSLLAAFAEGLDDDRRRALLALPDRAHAALRGEEN